MHYLTSLILASALVSFPLIGAAEERIERPIDYALDIHPIFVTKCYECHGNGQRKGGLQFNTREQLLQGTPFGTVVELGNPEASRLIEVVTAADPADRMPPKGDPLSAREVAVLKAWIEQDAPWSDEILAPSEYKAPLALDDAPIPAASPFGTAHLIDRFMDAYLEEKGIEKPAVVDDRRFARRAWLDATGLLPDPQLLNAFMAFGPPAKRTGLVTSLLSQDTKYAEHWMSFWNDHLRNDFEGTGFIDGGRMQITDWLFGALADNKPYDAFVRDLIAPPSGEAEGFIKGIVWRGDNAAVQLPSMQAARNVSQVFLGINLKCASCHDSFVDDWSLRDAFNFANVFSDDAMELVRCDTATGEMAGYGFLWPELGEIDGSQPRSERMARAAELTTSPENGHFTRTIVNRVWAALMGRGLVEPLDAMEREPWHPQMLDALARDFVANGYDMRTLIKTIMTSEAYQWPAVARDEQDDSEYLFTGPEVRRLSAEQFYDGLGQITGVWQVNPKFVMPEDRGEDEAERQAQLARLRASGKTEDIAADAHSIEGRSRQVRAWRVTPDALMSAMGRPDREQITTRREEDFTTLQALELSNGETLASYLQLGAQSLHAQFEEDSEATVDWVFRRAYQRDPTAEERTLAIQLLDEAENPQQALEDILWVLTMSPEFHLIM